MLDRAHPHSGSDVHRSGGRATSYSSKVVFAVAPSLRVVSPTHWGWPHWLAPVYRTAGQHPSSHRTLEEYQ